MELRPFYYNWVFENLNWQATSLCLSLPFNPDDEKYYDDNDDSNKDATHYYSNWNQRRV